MLFPLQLICLTHWRFKPKVSDKSVLNTKLDPTGREQSVWLYRFIAAKNLNYDWLASTTPVSQGQSTQHRWNALITGAPFPPYWAQAKNTQQERQSWRTRITCCQTYRLPQPAQEGRTLLHISSGAVMVCVTGRGKQEGKVFGNIANIQKNIP